MVEGTLAAWAAATTNGDEADNDNDDDCAAECWQPRDVDSGGDGDDDGRGRGRGCRAVNVNIKHGVTRKSEAGARSEKSKTVSFKSALVLGDW